MCETGRAADCGHWCGHEQWTLRNNREGEVSGVVLRDREAVVQVLFAAEGGQAEGRRAYNTCAIGDLSQVHIFCKRLAPHCSSSPAALHGPAYAVQVCSEPQLPVVLAPQRR